MRLNKAILALSAAALFFSCSKDYLDAEDNEYMSKEKRTELAQDPSVLIKLSGAAMTSNNVDISNWRSPLLSTHAAFGLRGMQQALDVTGVDMVMVARPQYIFDYEHGWHNAAHQRTRSIWYTFYKLISNANTILEDYFQEERDDATYNAIKAQLLALRGISHFHLVQYYQKTYVGSEDKPGVPIVLTREAPNTPRHSLREVYAQVIKDLTFAVEKGAATAVATDLDKNVAAAFLAKVYASMEDWTNAAKYAAIAKTGAEDVVRQPYSSWELGESKDILWGAVHTSNTTTLYASFYSMVDPYQDGYAPGSTYQIDQQLYDQIPATDSRRNLWLHQTNSPAIWAQYTQDKADGKAKTVAKMYDQVKYANTASGFTGDYSYIRVQDPILLEIEALNELGQTAQAANLLQAFVVKRDPSFVAASSQSDLRTQIRLQRRIELWMEGTHMLDMRRWKETLNRTTSANHTYQFNKAADAYLIQIPQVEIEANPLLKQND